MSAAAEETQFLAPAIRPEEDELERSLRPRNLDEFVGQERVKEQLAITLEAARGRKEALDHLLLIGPPGLGKTSLRSTGSRARSKRSSIRPSRTTGSTSSSARALRRER